MLYGRLRLKSIEIIRDAINVKVNEGLLAFGAQEEVAVFVVVHEEVFGQGLKFLDLVEQGGNRLWQIVKRDSLFCRIHCFLVLSETMASYFVATEKETRSPL